MIYGYKDIVDSLFTRGLVSYGFYDYDGNRTTPSGVAQSSYNGHQFAIKLDLGKKIKYKENYYFTPLAYTTYNNLYLKGYTEKGAGGSNLKVDSKSFDTLKLGLEGKFSADINRESFWDISPELKLGYSYDVINSKITSTSRFVDAGSSFKTEGLTPNRGSFNAGTAVTFSNSNGMDIEFSYDSEFNKKYISHLGFIKIKQKF